MLRLQILENYKTLSELQTNTMSGRILYLEQQNLRLKQIIYNLVNIAYWDLATNADTTASK